MKIGPAGAVVQVFQVRGGRVVERVELATESRDRRAPRRGDVLEAALQQFYELRDAPPEVHVPVEPDDREALESVARPSAPAARSASSCRSAARSAGWSISPTATRRSPIRRASTRPRPRSTTRSRRCRRVLALPALPRRIECFDISTIQGSETVASMVVCEDGRMRRGEYRKFRIRGEVQRLGSRRLQAGTRASDSTSERDYLADR